ncbi:hypothetical protein PsAD2_00508 [Pseudovibrio axinellae]|uniref:Uncharacterized protein n=1 Tax=Pseudovibrio axinellae TaxID=989403 RepID=A0A161V8D4_9HYPH|nr:hypothetical protein [Pseudovibrio axinellae]KZL21219.1 hypothetical protein PsAD2_00508 [Pseudovibrio axinellae]SEQ92435.1 hypothetical protein SAMN05421798_105131 [Pseudovibrio axinellae]
MSDKNPSAGEDLNALRGIISTHKSEIEDNAILRDNFKKLEASLAHREKNTLTEKRQILEHILSELGESAEDILRMSEESPQIDHHEAETFHHLDEQETLRDSLYRFRRTYLN